MLVLLEDVKIARHKWLTLDEEMRCARELAEKFAPFSPEYVLYLERGGERVGQAVADRFGIPSNGINLRYSTQPALE